MDGKGKNEACWTTNEEIIVLKSKKYQLMEVKAMPSPMSSIMNLDLDQHGN